MGLKSSPIKKAFAIGVLHINTVSPIPRYNYQEENENIFIIVVLRQKVNVFSLLALIIIKLFYREGHDNKITGKRYKKGLLKTH